MVPKWILTGKGFWYQNAILEFTSGDDFGTNQWVELSHNAGYV